MKNSFILLIICLLAAGIYYSWNTTLGILAGSAWGLINFYLIKQLLQSLLIAKQKSYLKIFSFFMIKFPLLYLMGYGLLLISYISPWSLLIGFSLILVASTCSLFWNNFRSTKKFSWEK